MLDIIIKKALTALLNILYDPFCQQHFCRLKILWEHLKPVDSSEPGLVIEHNIAQTALLNAVGKRTKGVV